MDIFKTFGTDEAKENEGVWCEIGSGTKLLVARSGNRKYTRMLAKLVEQNQRALDTKDDAADQLSDQILIDVMAQTILLGWEGVEFKGTKALPYSAENAKKLLAVKDFRKLVAKLADDFDNFRAAEEQELGKS